ncbi:MAG: hypothetical protein P1U64_04725 [Alcanivoracaceae bacterium]|jgi:hypothetical protein|nr:hypothetical protein [Alcanivoracaceae bacterium]
MTAIPVYVAFPVSERLRANVEAFVAAVAQDPAANHQQKLDAITDDFINELLKAFFDGPVEALGVRGGMARVINGVVSVINKSARAMVGRVFRKVTAEEQQALARHFSGIQLDVDGRAYSGFPLDPEMANEAALMFESFREGDGDPDQLRRVMRGIVDGAIEHFLDRSVACVRSGALTRGMVTTGRATIAKAAHSALEKTLPGMHPAHRKPVLGYFEEMLLEVAA